METLRYSQWRLIAIAAASLFTGLFFIFLLMSADATFSSRGLARLATTDFGRYFFLPLLTVICFTAAWRTAVTAMGDGKALECTSTHLVVTGIWGQKRIPWRSLQSLGVERTANYPYLVFEADGMGLLGGSTVRLPLGAVDMGHFDVHDLLEAIAERRTAALNPASPEAAARSAQVEVAAVQPSGPRTPVRPAFGRKVS